ncbi:MAG: hypothetical protein KatS3mg010_0949 [Acidimicrobiia bacterium]|nr:MAG: hypothetical protein KatS3mg010_0949 [Acidimicrobiia bacterium]
MFTDPADARRVAPVGLERDLREHGGLVPRLVRCEPSGHRRDEERRVGRVAGEPDAVARLVRLGFVRQGAGEEREAQRLVPCGVDRDDLAVCVTDAAPDGVDGVVLSAGPDLLDGHPVLGQRPGLVGSDHGGAAQRLDGGQPPDDRVATCHAPHPERERDREHDREALRDRRDRERDRREEHVVDRLAEQDSGRERDDRRDPDRDPDHPCEARHPLLEGRLLGRLGADHPGDLAERGPGARRDDDPVPAAARDDRPGVRHRHPVRDRRPRRDLGGALGARERLTGQKRLVDLQAVDPDESQVGRDPCPRLEQDDVTGDEVAAVELPFASVPDDPRAGNDELSQRAHGMLGAPLLCEPDGRVERQDGGDHARVDVLPERQGDDGRGEEDVDQRAPELPEQHDDRRRPAAPPRARSARRPPAARAPRRRRGLAARCRAAARPRRVRARARARRASDRRARRPRDLPISSDLTPTRLPGTPPPTLRTRAAPDESRSSRTTRVAGGRSARRAAPDGGRHLPAVPERVERPRGDTLTAGERGEIEQLIVLGHDGLPERCDAPGVGSGLLPATGARRRASGALTGRAFSGVTR